MRFTVNTNIGRIGGFERNFNDIAFQKLQKFLDEYPRVLKEFENLFTRNRIFMERTMGVGAISADRALNYGFTGPNLRAAGVDYDVRVHSPYSSYEDFQFDIPVGTTVIVMIVFLYATRKCGNRLALLNRLLKKCRNLKVQRQKYIMQMYRNITLPEKERCIYENGSTDLAFQNYHG